MQLTDCLTGLSWFSASSPREAARLARRQMAEKGNGLVEAVWVLCQSDGKPKKVDFAVLSGAAKGRVAAAAAFARGIGTGILVERLPNGFYWLGVAVEGVPLPGFDKAYIRDDALAALKDLPDSLRIDLSDVHVPQDFPQHHEGCRTFAEITERVREQDVAFRPIERGLSWVVVSAAAFSVAMVFAAGGYFWWKEHVQAEKRAQLAAEMREKRLLLQKERLLVHKKQAALEKALQVYRTAMGHLDQDWSSSMSVSATQYVGALVSRIAPSWGWTPVDFRTHGNLLVSHWVSDIPGHPDYVSFLKAAQRSGWQVAHNDYYTVLTLSRRVPDALAKVVVNPGYSDTGLLLNSLPASWKAGASQSYTPLPYERKDYLVKGRSLSSLAYTLHILKRVPGMRVQYISVNHAGWSMSLLFFEKTAADGTRNPSEKGVQHAAH